MNGSSILVYGCHNRDELDVELHQELHDSTVQFSEDRETVLKVSTVQKTDVFIYFAIPCDNGIPDTLLFDVLD